MMGAPPDLPPRFPCWCRATYSWGGETKKDLGFIEGDLIEALNAGDGLWWMGRLRRDPRAIGLFPSNFVKVLAETFQPAPNSRHASPLAQSSPNISPSPSKSMFRKPFDAYEKLGPRLSMDAQQKEGTPEQEKPKKQPSKFRPYASMKTAQAPQSSIKRQQSTGVLTPPEPEEARIPALPSRRGSRAPSPAPQSARASPSPQPPMHAGPHGGHYSRAPSPQPGYRAPSPQPGYHRAPSPQPGYHRAPSPQPGYRALSPQPGYRAPSPQPGYRAPSPQPGYRAPSPQPGYRAPSPQPGYRAHSPAPPRPHSPLPTTYHDGSPYPQWLPSRQPSPNPHQMQHQNGGFDARAPTASPCRITDSDVWNPRLLESYDDDEEEGDLGPASPPPPPPPAHRVAYQPSRPPSAIGHFDQNDRQMSRTPVPASPNGDNGSHMTPSPLRDAMADVMSSLQDMSMCQDESPARERQEPSSPAKNVWSPEAFDLVRRESRAQHQRAQSSLGLVNSDRYTTAHEEPVPSLPPSREGLPQLDDFVQRMEQQLRHTQSVTSGHGGRPPMPPMKSAPQSTSRPTTSSSNASFHSHTKSVQSHQRPPLRTRKSAYELGRTYTTKTNATNSTESSSATQSSNSTQLTSRSIMSGYSAGGFSATSAGSLARRKFGLGSQKSTRRPFGTVDTRSMVDISSSARSMAASENSAGSGPSYHESHASAHQPVITPIADWAKDPFETAGVLGGLSAPKAKKSGFFKKMIETAKTTARTGAANARSTIGSTSRPSSRASSPTKSLLSGNGITSIAGGTASRPGSSFGAGGAARDMGLGGGNEWMQVRRDINRSNSLSRREREDRIERCELHDVPALNPIEMLHELTEGDEGLDGLPIVEPTEFNTPNLALVDKSTRFIQSLPPMVTAATLSQYYVCRPHRSDVQRLRAIFTWVAERITWEDDFEGQIDTRRVIQTKRGCSEEIATLVRDMCTAVGLQAEVIQGYLKAPGEVLDVDIVARPNHWWNAVTVEGEWRIMDCSLAGPTNPRRGLYSNASSQVAESWYFLARPLEICYTHIPLSPEQQHIVPPVNPETLIALPCACPTYFRNNVELASFDTSMLHLENLEMSHLQINVPEDVECVAEVEARGFARDADGDVFESGDTMTTQAFAQAEWIAGRKRFTVKALLPGDDGQGVLKIYAGKRGLMHSIKDNPHSLALALPLHHTGQNPPFDFHIRHPTPHAQRHDLYVAQPQCARLVLNNTFVFCVRQHPSSLSRFSPDTWGTGGASGGGNSGGRPVSPNPYVRPGSAMSMVSATMSQSGMSTYSDPSAPMTAAQQRPAKLAIQTPSQKIIRLTRKQEHVSRPSGIGGEDGDGLTTAWETVIKIGERGTWRGLVLADRSARWCVFAEWECV